MPKQDLWSCLPTLAWEEQQGTEDRCVPGWKKGCVHHASTNSSGGERMHWSRNSAMKLREHFKTGTGSCSCSSHHWATFIKDMAEPLCPTVVKKSKQKKHWGILNSSPAPQISFFCLQQLDIQKAFVLQNWSSDPCHSWGHTRGFTRSSLVLKYIQQRTICHWLSIWKLMT